MRLTRKQLRNTHVNNSILEKLGPVRLRLIFIFCCRPLPSKIEYREGNPTANIKVKGPRGGKKYEAYLDTGAGRTLIPKSDAVKLGLEYVGATECI